MDMEMVKMLGLTQEKLRELVVEKAAQSVLRSSHLDEDGEEFDANSPLAQTLLKRVKELVDEKINALGEQHVKPNVAALIEKLSLQATNKWGEKRGEELTFVEYLVQRAEAYMQEKVDFQGKSKSSSNSSYGWKGEQTRLTHLVHEHLHYSIEHAMKDALQVANSAISKGIAETVKLKLAEVVKKLHVDVKTGR